MNKKEEITVGELSNLVLEFADKKYGSNKYAYAFGSLNGIFETARWGMRPVQDIINDAYNRTKKELEELATA